MQKTQILEFDFIKEAFNITNVTALLGKYYDMHSIEHLPNKDVKITYSLASNSPTDCLCEFVTVAIYKTTYSSGAILDYNKAVGVMYNFGNITLPKYFNRYKNLKSYADKFYKGRYKLTVKDHTLILIIELLDEEYHDIAQDYLVNKLSGNNGIALLKSRIKNEQRLNCSDEITNTVETK